MRTAVASDQPARRACRPPRGWAGCGASGAPPLAMVRHRGRWPVLSLNVYWRG
jgi:hypothetical protein